MKAAHLRARACVLSDTFRWVAVVSLVVCALLACCAGAEEEVDAAIRKLEADTFEDREAAEAELLSMGAVRVADAVMRGTKSTDPETALRCARLRRRILLGIDGETSETTIALLENMHKETDMSVLNVAVRKLLNSSDGCRALRTVFVVGGPWWVTGAAEMLKRMPYGPSRSGDATATDIALARAWSRPDTIVVAAAACEEISETIELLKAWKTLKPEIDVKTLEARLVYATGDVDKAADVWTEILASTKLSEAAQGRLDHGIYTLIEAGRWDTLADAVRRHWPWIAASFDTLPPSRDYGGRLNVVMADTIRRDCILATALHLAGKTPESDRLLDALAERCPGFYKDYKAGLAAGPEIDRIAEEFKEKEAELTEDEKKAHALERGRLYAIAEGGRTAEQDLCRVVNTMLLCGHVELALKLADRYNLTQIMLGIANTDGTIFRMSDKLRAREKENMPTPALELPHFKVSGKAPMRIPGRPRRRDSRLDEVRKMIAEGDIFGAREALSKVYLRSGSSDVELRIAQMQQMLEIELSLNVKGKATVAIRKELESGTVGPDPNAAPESRSYSARSPRDLWEILCPYADVFDLAGPGQTVDEQIASVVLAARLHAKIADPKSVGDLVNGVAEALKGKPVLKMPGATDKLITAYILTETYSLPEAGDALCNIYIESLLGGDERPEPAQNGPREPVMSNNEWLMVRATLNSLVRRKQFEPAAEVCLHIAPLLSRNLASYLYARGAFQMARAGSRERAQEMMVLAAVLDEEFSGWFSRGSRDWRPLHLAYLREGAFKEAIGHYTSQQLVCGGSRGPATRATMAESLPEDIVGDYENALRVRRCGMFVLLLPVVGPYGLRDQAVRALSFRWLYLANEAVVRAPSDPAALDALRQVAAEVVTHSPGAVQTVQFVLGCLDSLGLKEDADEFYAKASPFCDKQSDGWVYSDEVGLKQRFHAICGRDLEKTIETAQARIKTKPYDYANWLEILAVALYRAGRNDEALAVRHRAVQSFLQFNPPSVSEHAWLPDFFIPLTAYVR